MRIELLVVASLTTACAVDPASPQAAAHELDPTGTWDVDATWGHGTCGADYAWTAQFRVTSASDGGSYDVFDTLYNAPPTSSDVACTEDACVLTIGDIWPADGDGTLRLEMALVLGASGAVTAIGSASVTGTTTCHQSFTASGARR